jgi:hypothetical protein
MAGSIQMCVINCQHQREVQAPGVVELAPRFLEPIGSFLLSKQFGLITLQETDHSVLRRLKDEGKYSTTQNETTCNAIEAIAYNTELKKLDFQNATTREKIERYVSEGRKSLVTGEIEVRRYQKFHLKYYLKFCHTNYVTVYKYRTRHAWPVSRL